MPLELAPATVAPANDRFGLPGVGDLEAQPEQQSEQQSGSGGQPLNQQPPRPPRWPQQPQQQQQQQYRHHRCPEHAVVNLHRANVVGVMWSVPRAIAMLIVLSLTWDDECDQPLRLWVAMLTLQDCIRLPLRIHVLAALATLSRRFPMHRRGACNCPAEYHHQLGHLMRTRPFVASRSLAHLALG
jgi:hypothetical protein